jgi:hypothetical protein
MPGLVDIQKMKASTNEKKRQVRHIRFLAQCLVNAQPLPLCSIAPSTATQRRARPAAQLEAGELRAAWLTPVGRRRDEPGDLGDQPGVSQLVSTACCSTVIYYFVVTKSPKTLLNNTCQATATVNLPSSSQGCGWCGSAALPAREWYGVPCKNLGRTLCQRTIVQHVAYAVAPAVSMPLLLD